MMLDVLELKHLYLIVHIVEKEFIIVVLQNGLVSNANNQYDFNQQTQLPPCHQDSPGPWITAQLLMIVPIALPLDSLLLRGVSTGPCFCFRARRRKHAWRHARPRNDLKAGPALMPRNNRLSSGRAMIVPNYFLKLESKMKFVVTIMRLFVKSNKPNIILM